MIEQTWVGVPEWICLRFGLNEMIGAERRENCVNCSRDKGRGKGRGSSRGNGASAGAAAGGSRGEAAAGGLVGMGWERQEK